MPQQRVEQAGRRGGLGEQRVEARCRQQRINEIGRKPRRLGKLAGLDERGSHRKKFIQVCSAPEPRFPFHFERSQDCAGHCLLVAPPALAVQIGKEQPPEVLKVMAAHDIPGEVARRASIAAHDLGKVRIRIVAASDTRGPDDIGAPHLVAQPQEHIFEKKIARVLRFLASLRRPVIERGNRQNAIRLFADAQGGERSGGAHVVDEMRARPIQVVLGEVVLFPAEHVRQEVAPRRRPEGDVHLPRVELLLRGVVQQVGERLGSVRQEPQRPGERVAIRSVAGLEDVRRLLGEIALHLADVARAETGWCVRSVIRRRALQEEGEAVGVVMRVQQFFDALRGIDGAERRLYAEDQQHVQPCLSDVPRQLDSEAHAGGFGRLEIDHPFHPRIDRQLLGGGGNRRLRVGTGWQRIGNVFPRDAGDEHAARIRNRHPAIGKRASQRCTRPAFQSARRRRKLDRLRQRLIGGNRRGWAILGIERLEGARHPRGPLRIEAIGQLPPRPFPRFLVIAGAPMLLPIMLAPGFLLLGQLGLVRIEMHLVRIDPHAQLERAIRLRKEAGFQPHREKRQRPVARDELRGHLRRQRVRQLRRGHQPMIKHKQVFTESSVSRGWRCARAAGG